MKEIRIATRASKLALAQAHEVLRRLSALAPETRFSIVEVSTTGDRDKSDFLYKSESVGFFTSEVEQALLSEQADIAVHSLKDLPTAVTPGLMVSAIPPREEVCDVVVAAVPLSSLDDLPKKASVGTSSLRRITQLKAIRPDLNCRPLRGNVESRLRKVREGQIDAIVIARAGMNRLGLFDPTMLTLAPDEFIPAPGQGALAVQTRRDDIEISALAAQLDDPNTRITTETERRILAGLHGGCSIPLGVYSYIKDREIHIHAVLSSLDASRRIKKTAFGPVDRAMEIADEIIRQILDEGGRQILDEIRQDRKC